MRERICDVANLLELAELTEKLLLERCHPQSSDEFTVDQIVRVVNTIGRLTTIRKTLHQLDAAGQQPAPDTLHPSRSTAVPAETPRVDTPVLPASPQKQPQTPILAATATPPKPDQPLNANSQRQPSPPMKNPGRLDHNAAKPAQNARQATPAMPAG